MYCPNCGNANIKTARFCRRCGTNITFASQSLGAHTEGLSGPGEATNQLGVQRAIDRNLQWATEECTQKAFKKISSGLVFLVAAIFFFRERWGIWLLFPAFAMLGKGISILIANRVARPAAFEPPASHARPEQYSVPAPGQYSVAAPHEAPRTGELSRDTSPDTSMPLAAPPSVTEGTTKIIAPAAKQYSEHP
jgi:hypothetical protein